MDFIEQYKNEQMRAALEREKIASELRLQFIKDYPIENIADLTLDEYLIAKEGYGNDRSFCRRLLYDLKPIASMGNVRFDVFGVFFNAGMQIELSKTFKNAYSEDVNSAFNDIKGKIVQLLNDANHDNYSGIADSKLNSSFKYKLLSVYYWDKFIPVCTKETLEGYCTSVGLQFNASEDMIYRNIELRDWKDSVPEIAGWSNFILMTFCDWLWRSQKKVNGPVMRKDVSIAKANEIDQEINNLNLVGEIREAVVNIRVNQGEFRNRLLRRYNRCCLCGVDNPELLVASHIKPWSESEPEEKLDVDNGFLMCPNHDRLFDKGLITFDDEGHIQISEQLNKENQIFTNVSKDMKIELTENNKKYLKYHRENVFRSDK